MKLTTGKLALLFGVFFFGFSLLQADTTTLPYPLVPAKPGEKCTVCGTDLSEDDVALIVKGRRVPLDRTMVDEFLANQGMYFSQLQPKGALFQEDLDSPAGTSLGGLTKGWFLFGLFVLVSLVFAGLSGYAAVSKGLRPLPHFLIGLFFSAFGFIYVITRPSTAPHGGIPHGLVKVPVTASPVPCEKCGGSNHPSAETCASCGAKLKPRIESEVERAMGERR
jgi:hypothetical protein